MACDPNVHTELKRIDPDAIRYKVVIDTRGMLR